MKLIRMVASGEYSDYHIHGLVTVDCQDSTVWLRDRLTEYLDAHPNEREPYSGSTREFYQWLLARPDVSEVTFEELYIGAYGNLEASVR